MEREQYLGLKGSKLIKKMGFDGFCLPYYKGESLIFTASCDITEEHCDDNKDLVKAPLLQHAILWLDGQGVIIQDYYNDSFTRKWMYRIHSDKGYIMSDCKKVYSSRFKCWEAAILTALEFIKKQRKQK